MKVILNIRQALDDNGMTSRALSEKLGVTGQSVSSLINGNPSMKKVYEIADALECDVRDLFYAVDDNGHVLSHLEERLRARKEKEAQQQKVAEMAESADEEKPQPDNQQPTASPELPFADEHSETQPSGNRKAEQQQARVDIYRAYICPHCGTKFLVLSEPDK